MNSLAQYILYLYLIVFLSVLFFDVTCIFIRKLNDQHLKKLKAKMLVLINQEKGSRISLKHQKKLIRKLKKINYFIAFTNIMDEMNTKEKVEYLKNLKYTFIKILPHYQKEEVIRETYFVHFLKENPYIYKENENAIIEYLINSTKKPSIYLRENALNALNAVGNVAYIKESLYQMNYLNIHHHHKLITDGLLKFTGNQKKLAEMLLQNIKEYQEEYQIACINYFSYQKIDCQKEIYQMLKNKKTSKEVRIACIRYFSNKHYEPILPILYELLEQDKNDWEYAAVAATTLKNYPQKETTLNLMKALKSHNWYVRNNAAISLTKINSDEIIYTILKKLDDKYAIDALTYQIRLQRKEG